MPRRLKLTRRNLQQLTIALLSILTIIYLTLKLSRPKPPEKSLRIAESRANRFLDEQQCLAAFPENNREIDNAVEKGSVELQRLPDNTQGLVQGRLSNGKLYIISAAQENSLHRISAILHSLHRAIITSPTPLPDTIFALSINDIPQANAWSFSRSDDGNTPDTPWLMPHYSYWSWPLEPLGPLDEAIERIDAVERSTTWDKKIDKAVWRGTQWFGPDWKPRLRLDMLALAEKQEWADVQAWVEGGNNTLSVEEFCRYRYIIYAEGKTYSGRLPYHQACGSIILTPPPTFLLHNTHLLRPVFSSVLQLPGQDPRPLQALKKPIAPPPSSYPVPETSRTWPLSYPPTEANIIFVSPDWADLELVIKWLRLNPKIAKGIAARQRELMVGKGYLSEGAEACYWRALIRAWSMQARVVNEAEWSSGMRWETYSLLGQTTYAST